MLEKGEIETEKFRQEILKRHRHLFDLNKSLFQLADDMINTGKTKRDAPLHDVIAFLFSKAFKTFQAVDILCQRGYGQDAAILARSLFEILVTARYLAKGDDTLVAKFVGFDGVLAYKHIANPLLSDKQKEEIKKRYQDVKHLYDDNKRKDTWSGKSIKEMAEEVGLYNEYGLYYQLLSNLVHSDALSAQDYIRFLEGTMECECGPSEKFLQEVIIINSFLFLHILNNVNQMFKIGFNSQIEEIEKLLDQNMKKFGDS